MSALRRICPRSPLLLPGIAVLTFLLPGRVSAQNPATVVGLLCAQTRGAWACGEPPVSSCGFPARRDVRGTRRDEVIAWYREQPAFHLAHMLGLITEEWVKALREVGRTDEEILDFFRKRRFSETSVRGWQDVHKLRSWSAPNQGHPDAAVRLIEPADAREPQPRRCARLTRATPRLECGVRRRPSRTGARRAREDPATGPRSLPRG